MVTVILLVVFLGSTVACGIEGIWSNALRLVNIVLAGLIATSYFEVAATVVTNQFPSWKYHVDTLMLPAVFAAAMMVLRTVTDRISRVKARFIPMVDKIGGAVLGAICGWLLVCITCVALHMAPLGASYLGDEMRPISFMGMNPDLQWLSFMHKQSRGAFSSLDVASNPSRVFDPNSEFITRYYLRRKQYDDLGKMKPTVQTGS